MQVLKNVFKIFDCNFIHTYCWNDLTDIYNMYMPAYKAVQSLVQTFFFFVVTMKVTKELVL